MWGRLLAHMIGLWQEHARTRAGAQMLTCLPNCTARSPLDVALAVGHESTMEYSVSLRACHA